MKLDINQFVTMLDGTPLQMESRGVKDGRETTVPRPVVVGLVLQNACMAHPAPGTSYEGSESVQRYSLAIEIEKALKDHEPGTDVIAIEIDAKTATMLQREIARTYPPLVAGQVIPLLDGK